MISSAATRWRNVGTSQRLAGVVGLALIAGYLAIAVFSQPLGPAGIEGFVKAPGQSVVNDPTAQPIYPPEGSPALFVSWVYGATATLVASLENGGFVGMTITGIETSPSYWRGPITIKDPRAAVMVVPHHAAISTRLPPGR
jgi:hypothetical protein